MTKHNQFNYGITAPSSWYRKASCGISSPPPLFSLRKVIGLEMNINKGSVGNNDGTRTIYSQYAEAREQIRRTDSTTKVAHTDDNFLIGENKHYHTRTWCGDNLTFGGRDEGDIEHSIQTHPETTWNIANVA